ncbi:GAF domain-containing sensor histidine kinase [Crocosphaera chwakensis]|uniref:histidine kinase n=1 Tax=Crocosphaera chwakensis CCY0110 TaxID=391612 RepID=A3IP54_9CHRO|nr:GAF domain-containing sensor histidine kinase [Crocosphaera chwakensis]EAZ91619.1 GAF Sensor Signal Transduction Histidine Kinase [Crocosphaera chwakensis CCY0110]
MQVQAVNLGVNINTMFNSTSRLFCRLDGLSPAVREQKRVKTLKHLGLLDTEIIPIFDEATQTAAHFIDAPICLLGIMVQDQFWLKSAVGLSRLGLMNDLASTRKIPRQEAFSTYVVDSEQPLAIHDTLQDPIFAKSSLVQHYGIRAFLGTPLITAEGQCLGTLTVMDLVPRQFTPRDVEFLTITARWCLREFERNHLLKTQSSQENECLNLMISNVAGSESPESKTSSASASINTIKLQLLRQLMEEFRTPLTSVIGMSSVLQGEVFGSLTTKQKEYLKIIYGSGQQMNSLVKEILTLGISHDAHNELQLNPVNIEMLAQNTINSLAEVVNQKRQTLRLSVEPGKRIWLLDKEIVRQGLYYLILSILESGEVGGEVRIHISRRTKTLNIAVWVSHPWLGDGLPQVNFHPSSAQKKLAQLHNSLNSLEQTESIISRSNDYVLRASSLEKIIYSEEENQLKSQHSPELLGLLLCCHLIENHGGKIMVQGSRESGYRYVLMLPKIGTDAEPHTYRHF